MIVKKFEIRNSKFEIKGRRILVVGLARSGVGAANLLSSFGARVCATDIKSRDFLKDNIKKLLPSIEVVAGRHPEEIFTTADMIVVSPGVPLNIPPLIHAKARGIPIIGELELAYQVIEGLGVGVQSPIPFIVVTGTNGKSTTTILIDLMLRKSGFKTLLGGNIGNALTEELYKLKVKSEKLKVDYIVAETSSFQLESVKCFKPFVAVILNITPDHLNRYRNMEDYINAKTMIFKNQGSDDYLILNADDPVITKLRTEKLEVRGEKRPKVLFFSREGKVEGIFYKDGGLFYKLLSTPGTPPPSCFRKKAGGVVPPPFNLIEADKIKIKGPHNLENAMAASLTALLCGCPPETIREVLKDFPGLEHRLESVCEIKGVRFVNDSKGTNVGAVIKSIESLQNIVLIMGGRDKDGDFTSLKDLIKKKVKALILLGEAKEKIARAIGGAIETVFAKDMKEAVELSMSKASDGDVVLLSPGCASFDMFRDFEDRGRKFKEAVYEIQK